MKGKLVLVSPGKGHLENKQVQIPETINQLFVVDGIPITQTVVSLILRARSEESILILRAEDPVSWYITINNLWSTRKEDQALVVVAPNKDLFRIAENIAPKGCRLMLSTYRPGGYVFISIDGRGEFEIIAS